MPGTVLVEIPFDKEAGFSLGAVNSDGTPGVFEAGTKNWVVPDGFYKSAPSGTEDPPVDVWVGCTVAGSTGVLEGSGDADLGTGVSTIVDQVSLKSVPSQAVAAVISSVTFRPKTV